VLRGAIRISSAVAARLPEPMVERLSVLGGTLEWAARPAKRRTLAENLSRALGESPSSHRVRRLVRLEVQNEARRSADFLWALRRPKELIERSEVVGIEHLGNALGGGRGVVLTSFHLGGWEVVDSLPRALGFTLNVLVTDDWLAWAVAPMRERAGLRVIYDSEPVRRSAQRLQSGEALLVLADYAKPSMRTYTVRLFGQEVDLPAGPATLSRLCGSPIVPFVAVPTGPRRWRVIVESPVPAPSRHGGREAEWETLQALADRFTDLARMHARHWAAVYPMAWR